MAKQLRLCVTGKILSPNEDEKSNLKKLQASYRGVGEHPCFPVTLTFGERPRVARMNKFLEQLEKLFEMMIFQPPVQPAEVAESAVPDTAERAEARQAAGNAETAVNAAGAVADDALVPYVEALYALDERKQIIDDAVDLLIDLVCRDGVPPTPNAPASLHPMQLAWISDAISCWGRQGKHRFPATWTALPQVAELLAYLRHLAPAEQCSADPQAAETGFELTQLIGWISLNCLTAYKFAVPVRGTIHDTFADYQAGARFDIFGPDGSQLASCRVDPEHLRLAVLDALLPATASACLPSPTCDTAPESQGLCVTIDDASDLRYVLRQRADSEAAAQRAPLARLNSPTFGQVKFPQAGQSGL